MKDYKFVFVILHYYTIKDTQRCIESILEKCKNSSIEIVIIDNASPNETGKELEELYRNNEKIHIIVNKKNLGFANGNNIGFKYAKEKLNADFIIMCNNDTYLLQHNFLELIEKEFKRSNFAVLGPKILLPNNQINKLITELPTIKIIKKQMIDAKINLVMNYIYLGSLYKKIRKLLKNVLINLRIRKKVEHQTNHKERQKNIILHGCFLIFSKEYIKKFDGLDDRTFLYREEELLAIRLKKNDLISVYNPQIEIFHNEDGATNAITKSNRKKQLFVCRNQIKSTKILLKELKIKGEN